MTNLETALADIQEVLKHTNAADTFKVREALAVLTALRLGAQTFATHVQRFQNRWERGDYTEAEHLHVAQLTHAFVNFVHGLENPDAAEHDPMLWLGALALGSHMPGDLFISPENEHAEMEELRNFSREIDAKYGPVEAYRWCKHGFLHAIDCEEGCTKADCRTEWPAVSDEDVR